MRYYYCCESAVVSYIGFMKNDRSSPADDISSERCESVLGMSTDKPAETDRVPQTPSTRSQKNSKSNTDVNKNGK